MKLGEVCLLTRDVPRLAAFYQMLLQTDHSIIDPFHQTIIAQETMLTIMHDDGVPDGQSAVLAFSVDDIDAEYRRLLAQGVTVLQPPERKPWGAVNMMIQDPDSRTVYLRKLQGGAL